MHHILIVDDERPARDLLAELIAFYIPDSKVSQAECACKALEMMQTENYDLLFVDISMPDMTGLELLEEIHRRGKKPSAFIITAHQQYEYAVKGFRMGILDYIEKPLHKKKIYKAAKLYLSKTNKDAIDLKIYTGVRRVPAGSVIAIEAAGRGKVKVYTTDSVLSEVTGSLAQFYGSLPANFCYIRRDCIINLHEIVHYNLKSQAREVYVVCQNEKIMFRASRKNMKDLLNVFSSNNIEKDEE